MAEGSEELKLSEKLAEDLSINGVTEEIIEKHGQEPEDVKEQRAGVLLLQSWINKCIKIEMTDGRFIMGVFLCTDKSSNVIIGNCTEYTRDPDSHPDLEEPRMLGLAMVPGHHIVKLYIDQYSLPNHSQPNRTSPTSDSDS